MAAMVPDGLCTENLRKRSHAESEDEVTKTNAKTMDLDTCRQALLQGL